MRCGGLQWTAWLVVAWLALAGAGLEGQSNVATIKYLHPSTTDFPLNSKVLVGVTCCGVANVALSTGGRTVAAKVESYPLRDGTSAVVLIPAAPLLPRTVYQVTFTMYDGRAPLVATFTTGTGNDTTPPRVVKTVPGDGQDFASASPNLSIQFSKAMYPGGFSEVAPVLIDLSTTSTSSVASWSFQDPATVGLDSFVTGLRLGTAYRLRYGSKLPQDLAGNTPVAPLDVVFTTYPEAPKDGPKLQGSTPAEGETGAPTNSSIYLHFDRAISPQNVSGFTLAAANDPGVTLKVEAGPVSAGLILRPQTLLRANQDYTLTASGVLDAFGGRGTGFKLHFRTGALPETRQLTQLSAPPPVVAAVATLRWTFSRALNPFVLPRLGRRDVQQSFGTIPSTPVRLLPDGLTVEADVPGPGAYTLIGQAMDRVQATVNNVIGTGIVTVQPVKDTQAPVALAVFPVAGTAVGAAAQPGAYFDEQIDAVSAIARSVLWRGDTAVPADVRVVGAGVTIVPKQPLADGDYRVEMQVRDLGGNDGEKLEWTFHAPADPAAERFVVTGVEPADGTQNVDANAAITVTFNRPPNPVSFYNGFGTSVGSRLGLISGQWQVEGARATFRPDTPLPGGMRVFWNVGPTDAFGNRTSSTGGFWTAAAPAPAEPFRVVSSFTSVQADSLRRSINLQLNLPASGETVTSQNILVTGMTAASNLQISYDMATRRMILANLDGAVHVFVGPGVLSQAGTPLEPFVADFDLTALASSNPPVGSGTVGPFLRTGPDVPVPSGGPIDVYFLQPMARELVERGLRVYSGGSTVTGRIVWTPDSTALTFLPAAPLDKLAPGMVVLSLIPFGGVGVEATRFSVQQPPVLPVYPRWNLTDPFATVPSDSVIDMELETAPAEGYVISASVQNTNANPPILMPLEVEAVTPRRFRFRAAKPLPKTLLWVIVNTKDGELRSPFFGAEAWATPVSRQVFTGPTLTAGPVPLNSLIWIESHTVMNHLSLTATLTVDGESTPFVTEVTDQGFLIRLRPVGLLRGNSTYTVSLTGLEDMAGRPLADRTWQFQTGAGPDLAGARLVSWSPVGVAPASSTFSVTFDKPVHQVRHPTDSTYSVNSTDFLVRTPSVDVPGNIWYSEDGKTLTFVPLRPWPVSTAIGLTIDRFHYFDWTGRELMEQRTSCCNELIAPAFVTAPPGVLAGPVIEAVNPYRDALNVPINVQIQARFAEAVDSGTLRVRLEREGVAAPVKVNMGADGRTLTITPLDMLVGDSNYKVTVEGVDSWTFRTSATIQRGDSPAAITRMTGDKVSFRVDAGAPWNPVSVTAGLFSLQVNGFNVGSTVRMDGSSVVVAPLGPVAAGAACQLTVKAADWAGNTVSGVAGFQNCAAAVDREAPRLNLLPAEGGTIAFNQSAIVTADEPFVLRYGMAGIRLSANGSSIPVRWTARGRPACWCCSPWVIGFPERRIRWNCAGFRMGTAMRPRR